MKAFLRRHLRFAVSGRFSQIEGFCRKAVTVSRAVPASAPMIAPTQASKRWNNACGVGRYWRSALVVFFNYGVDTGTVWKSAPFHEPILWRHVSWGRQSPDREVKEQSRWGWLGTRLVASPTGTTHTAPRWRSRRS